MKTQSDQDTIKLLMLTVLLLLLWSIGGRAAIVAGFYGMIELAVIVGFFLAIAVPCVLIQQRVHRWRHPPKPPMSAEERARRRAARPPLSAAEVQRIMAGFERARAEQRQIAARAGRELR